MTDLAKILSQFPLATVTQIEPLGGAGGFSGAAFWRIQADQQQFCLRRWPREHPDRARLHLIHSALLRAAQSGIDWIASPISSRQQKSFVEADGYFWELTCWKSGVADYWLRPNDTKLTDAAVKLAELHQAFDQATSASDQPAKQPPKSLNKRLGILSHWMTGGARQLLQAIRVSDDRQLDIYRQDQLAEQIVELFLEHAPPIRTELEQTARLAVPAQICVRDIWHDHLLFTGDELTGVVDFGALDYDVIAADIARLFGSLFADDFSCWLKAIDAYQTRRRLGLDLLRLISSFDRSSTLLSGMNWLQWLFVDRRRFSDSAAVVQRLKKIRQRMLNLDSIPRNLAEPD
jgi:Ser/Thr protein kinase RdoA (MazF antagonist)